MSSDQIDRGMPAIRKGGKVSIGWRILVFEEELMFLRNEGWKKECASGRIVKDF